MANCLVSPSVDPSLVIDFACCTMSLVGNASHCALTDRRKSLLAKVSAECLDLVDDQALFVPGTSDMFGKKLKKAVVKDLKLAKEMDISLAPVAMATVKTNGLSLFASNPGKARATISGNGANGAGIKCPQPSADFGEDFPSAKENPITSQARKSKISRYCSNSFNKNNNFKPNRSETVFTCPHFDFQSFKRRFCSGGKSSVISKPLRAFSAKLASNYKRPYKFRDDTGLQT